jgi:hypothetical protein
MDYQKIYEVAVAGIISVKDEKGNEVKIGRAHV